MATRLWAYTKTSVQEAGHCYQLINNSFSRPTQLVLTQTGIYLMSLADFYKLHDIAEAELTEIEARGGKWMHRLHPHRSFKAASYLSKVSELSVLTLWKRGECPLMQSPSIFRHRVAIVRGV